MALEDKTKLLVQNIEGKAQEALGNVTGDPKDQAEGKNKTESCEARGTSGTEDVKESS